MIQGPQSVLFPEILVVEKKNKDEKQSMNWTIFDLKGV